MDAMDITVAVIKTMIHFFEIIIFYREWSEELRVIDRGTSK